METETEIFKVLSDATRLRLAVLLATKGETCVCQLAQSLDEPEYKISRHLGIMKKANMLQSRRDGTWIYYRLTETPGKLEQCLHDCFKSCFKNHPTTKTDIKRLINSHCK